MTGGCDGCRCGAEELEALKLRGGQMWGGKSSDKDVRTGTKLVASLRREALRVVAKRSGAVRPQMAEATRPFTVQH